MINVTNLEKQYDGNIIFKDINLKIDKGDSIVIIGSSGCGKSTFLRCLNRLEEPTDGIITFHNKDIHDKDCNIDNLRTKVGMVYQNFNLFSHLNVLENMILAPMKVNHISKEDAIKEATKLLQLVGMDNKMYHMPSQLSGGQKQRVAIARCLIMHPEVILFDEPTSALDPTMVDEVESVIKKLVDSGMTSIIVTHEMEFAKNIATKIVFMAEQSIYEIGTPEQIFKSPKKEKTRTFIEKLKVLELEITKENLDIYSFISKVKNYCIPYGFSKKQIHIISLIYEEIVYKIVKDDTCDNVFFRLRCSQKEDYKDVYVDFHGIDGDPYAQKSVDVIGATLVKNMVNHYDTFCSKDKKVATLHFNI